MASSSILESAASATDRFLVVDGARLRYRDEGCGSAVLFVHGWTLDLGMWDPQVAALCDRFRVVRFDRRGHGLSDGVSSTEQDVRDITALCERLALTEVALVGMSQGARVAAQAAAMMKGVWALILDGMPPLIGAEESEIPLRHYRSLVRERGMAEFRAQWARHPLTKLRIRDPGIRALLETALARYSGNDLRSPAHAELTDLPVRLANLKVPVLVVSGQHDLPTRLRAADGLAAELKAERVVIAGAGHLPNLGAADAYSEYFHHFLGHHAPADHSS